MNTIKYNNLNLREGQLMLDMGCGEGRHSIGALLETPASIVGMDLSFEDLKIAQSRLKDFDTSELSTSCTCLLYTSPSPRDMRRSRMPSSA